MQKIFHKTCGKTESKFFISRLPTYNLANEGTNSEFS